LNNRKCILKKGAIVTLIQPPVDPDFLGLEKVYPNPLPPTGLAILASVIYSVRPDITIRILDGNLLSIGEILDAIHGDLIGISDWSTFHNNAMLIAKESKGCLPDSPVIIGGPNATHLAEQILRNHTAVDAVVIGDGEDATSGLVLGHTWSNIPNFAFRDKQRINRTRRKVQQISSLPLFNFCYLLPQYDKKREPIPVASIRGCIKAAQKGTCRYCSLVNKTPRVTPPEKVWQQIDLLNSKYGASYFFETGDDFMLGNYAEKLLSNRPKKLSNIKWRIYAYPLGLTTERIQVLQKLNIQSIFIGFEAINKDILAKMGRKGLNAQGIRQLLSRLHTAGIKTIGSFMFGFPGDDKKTIIKLRCFIEEIALDYSDSFEAIQVSLVTPIAGSQLFADACNHPNIKYDYYKATGGYLDRIDIIDYKLLVKLYLKHIVNIEYEWLAEQLQFCINTIIKKNITRSTFLGIENNQLNSTK
jgi:radical SAM superfamily enzyme YgiQ (UPF0313 family)